LIVVVSPFLTRIKISSAFVRCSVGASAFPCPANSCDGPFNEKLGLVGFHHKLAKGSCQFTIILHGAVDFKIGFRDKGESQNSNSCL
jgi:hypothetical protein